VYIIRNPTDKKPVAILVAPRYMSEARCTSCSLCSEATKASELHDIISQKTRNVTALALSTTINIDIINKENEAQY
jgi:hypothetical protein